MHTPSPRALVLVAFVVAALVGAGCKRGSTGNRAGGVPASADDASPREASANGALGRPDAPSGDTAGPGCAALADDFVAIATAPGICSVDDDCVALHDECALEGPCGVTVAKSSRAELDALRTRWTHDGCAGASLVVCPPCTVARPPACVEHRCR